VPPDIEKKCDYLYNSGRLPIEYNIPESEAALSCSCSDLSCNTVGECKNLGWNPHDFSDSGAPYAECFRYSNTSVFPTGAGEDVWANLPHEWGACRYDENRWSDVVVPGSVSSGNYYLSVRLGFTALDQENLKLEVLDSGGAVKKTFTTNDLWGLEQSPDNSFVECTFSETVALDSNYRLKFSAPNTSLYLDWYQITDTPPGYHPCDGEPIRKES